MLGAGTEGDFPQPPVRRSSLESKGFPEPLQGKKGSQAVLEKAGYQQVLEKASSQQDLHSQQASAAGPWIQTNGQTQGTRGRLSDSPAPMAARNR